MVVAPYPVELHKQIIKAGQTNLSPYFVQVVMTGHVRDYGSKVVPQEESLDKNLAPAGVTKLLRDQVELIRFNRNGTTDHHRFYRGDTPTGTYKNSYLMARDMAHLTIHPSLPAGHKGSECLSNVFFVRNLNYSQHRDASTLLSHANTWPPGRQTGVTFTVGS